MREYNQKVLHAIDGWYLVGDVLLVHDVGMHAPRVESGCDEMR